MLRFRTLLIILVAAAITGCAGGPAKPPAPKPAHVLYKAAHDDVASANWPRAIKELENLAATYPFGDYAVQAQLDLMFSYYMSGDQTSAQAEAEHFTREHPRSDHVPYAMYIRGLAQFPRGLSPLWKPFPVSPIGFEPNHARKSFKAFHDLVMRFPESKYAPDARQRMIFLRDRLAKYQIKVARYYIRRGAWLAAVRRAEFMVKHYPQTANVPAALKIIVKGYRKLGMNNFADEAQNVLKANAGRYTSKG